MVAVSRHVPGGIVGATRDAVGVRIDVEQRLITLRARYQILVPPVAEAVVVIAVLPGRRRVRPRLRRIQPRPGVVGVGHGARGVQVVGDGGDLAVVLKDQGTSRLSPGFPLVLAARRFPGYLFIRTFSRARACHFVFSR